VSERKLRFLSLKSIQLSSLSLTQLNRFVSFKNSFHLVALRAIHHFLLKVVVKMFGSLLLESLARKLKIKTKITRDNINSTYGEVRLKFDHYFHFVGGCCSFQIS
jgi:hypothetical protein